MEKYKEIGIILMGVDNTRDNNNEKIVNILQNNGYVICTKDKIDNKTAFGILQEIK